MLRLGISEETNKILHIYLLAANKQKPYLLVVNKQKPFTIVAGKGIYVKQLTDLEMPKYSICWKRSRYCESRKETYLEVYYNLYYFLAFSKEWMQ